MAEPEGPNVVTRLLNAAWVRPFLFLIFIVVLWDLTIRLFGIPAYQIPSPGDVVAVLRTEWPELLRQSWPTTYATICGFLLSALFGIPVAMLIAGSKTVAAMGLLPPVVAALLPPAFAATGAVVFAAIVLGISHLEPIRAITNIADPYFANRDKPTKEIGLFRWFGTTEGRIGRNLVALSIFVNFADVALTLRFNFFYRDITNLIELVNTGEEGSEGEGTFIYQPQNVGDGKVYGVEFDLSTDLGFIGLPNTGIFGNVSWLDSEITDFFGKRRFNGQSDYVYNVGFIQDIPSWGVAFGATHRKQGAAYDRVIGEEIRTTYGADLEIFVEKRFGKSFTIRAVGQNLLNGAKRERFNKFTTVEDQIDRNFDEYELEREKAGPVFQLMARYAF